MTPLDNPIRARAAGDLRTAHDEAGPAGGPADAGTLPVIDMVKPMPGFPDDQRFVLVQVGGDGFLFALTSLDSPELRFLVTPPVPYFPDYAPPIGAEILELLGEADPDRLLILLIVTAGDSMATTTANLMAPIVLDGDRRRAVQLVLSGSGLPVRQPLING